jgi:hypothetical protein
VGDRPDLPSSAVDAAWDDELNTRPLTAPPDLGPIGQAPGPNNAAEGDDPGGGDEDARSATSSFADTDLGSELGEVPVPRLSETGETVLVTPDIDTTRRDPPRDRAPVSQTMKQEEPYDWELTSPGSGDGPRPPQTTDIMGADAPRAPQTTDATGDRDDPPRPPAISESEEGDRPPSESAGEFGSTYVEARDWRKAAKKFAVAHAQNQGERTERPARPFVVPAVVEPTVMQWTPDDVGSGRGGADVDRTERPSKPFVPPSEAPDPPPIADRTEIPAKPFVPPVERTVMQAPMAMVEPPRPARPEPIAAGAPGASGAPPAAGDAPQIAPLYDRADASTHAPVSSASASLDAPLSINRLKRLPPQTLALAGAGLLVVVVTVVSLGWLAFRKKDVDSPGPSSSADTPLLVPSGEAAPGPTPASAEEIEAEARRALERLREGVTACVRTIGNLPGTSPAVPARIKQLREGPYESAPAEWRTPVWLCTKYRESGPQRFQIQWQQAQQGKAEGMGIAWFDADRDGAPDRALGFSATLKKRGIAEVGDVTVLDAVPPVIQSR